jgi:hypothetical protein
VYYCVRLSLRVYVWIDRKQGYIVLTESVVLAGSKKEVGESQSALQGKLLEYKLVQSLCRTRCLNENDFDKKAKQNNRAFLKQASLLLNICCYRYTILHSTKNIIYTPI